MIKLGDVVSIKGQSEEVGYIVIQELDNNRCAIEEITDSILKPSFVFLKSELNFLF